MREGRGERAPKINVFRHNTPEIQRNLFFHVLCLLLLLNLVEELYCQNSDTTEPEILYEDRFSSQVGPRIFFLCKQCCLQVNNINSLWQYIIIAIHVSIIITKKV